MDMVLQEKIRVGIVGLGAIGDRLGKGFFKHPETDIVAVCDVLEELAKQKANEFQAKYWYTDYMELIHNQNVDLVYVAVPPLYHHPIVLAAAKARKHILCEKPLANSIAEAESMLEAVTDAGVVHGMNFPLNYSDPVRKMEELILEGYLGELRRVEIQMYFPMWPRPWQQSKWVAGREQGGYIREVGPHFFQLTHRLFGRLEYVNSFVEYPENPEACETGVIAKLKLESGQTVLVNGLSQIARKENISYTAYGTEGTLSLVNWSILYGGKSGEEITQIAIREQENSQSGLISNLVNAIRGKEAEIYDFKVGLEVQKIIEAILNRA